MKLSMILAVVGLSGLPCTGIADDLISDSHANARVYLIEPADGATTSTTFKVKFGLEAMGVAPAGANIKNTGHHHLLIDVEALPDMSKPLPASDQVKHFGGGQTETQLTLAPGVHTLQLLLGNHVHIPHKPPVLSEKITITVR
ncbi:MAG: hypothetical protein ACI9DC_000443 [Gammaproteobacteria bacterium]|jgi:hypothetical protein